jgi:hypothetical protein
MKHSVVKDVKSIEFSQNVFEQLTNKKRFDHMDYRQLLLYEVTFMRRITTFRSTTDRI